MSILSIRKKRRLPLSGDPSPVVMDLADLGYARSDVATYPLCSLNNVESTCVSSKSLPNNSKVTIIAFARLFTAEVAQAGICKIDCFCVKLTRQLVARALPTGSRASVANLTPAYLYLSSCPSG